MAILRHTHHRRLLLTRVSCLALEKKMRRDRCYSPQSHEPTLSTQLILQLRRNFGGDEEDHTDRGWRGFCQKRVISRLLERNESPQDHHCGLRRVHTTAIWLTVARILELLYAAERDGTQDVAGFPGVGSSVRCHCLLYHFLHAVQIWSADAYSH